MTFQPGSMNYSVAFGASPDNVAFPHVDTRAPNSTDILYPIGKRWINTLGNTEYTLTSQSSGTSGANSLWTLLATAGGALNTLTGDSGGAISPSASNITLSGTGSQITTTGSGSTLTFSIPSTFLAPGSIASTTTLTAGSSLSVTTSATVGTTLGVTGLTTLAALTQVGTANINATGAAVTTIGNVGSTLAINAPTTLTLASGSSTGLTVTTAAGTGVAGTFTSTNATTDSIQALGGGIKTAPVVVTAGASPQTANGRFVQVTFSGVSIASGASQTFVISNSVVTGSSTVIDLKWFGATAGSGLSVSSITPSAGSISIVMTNATSATMVTSVANITFNVWVQN